VILYLIGNHCNQWRRQTRGVGCVRTLSWRCIIFLKQDSAFRHSYSAFRHECNGRYWYSNSIRPFVCSWHSGILSKRLNVYSALEVFYKNALYKFTFDIDVLTFDIQRWSKLFHRRIAPLPSFRITNRCYEIRTAVTVTPSRASNTEAVSTILKLLSCCVRGLSRKRCKIVTISDHSNQKSYVYSVIFISLVTWQRPVCCVNLNWHQCRQTCWVLRREVEGVRAATNNVLPPSNVRHDASPQLLSCFHWGSVAVVTRSPVKSSVLDRNREGRRWLKIRLETIRVTQPLWKISSYATECNCCSAGVTWSFGRSLRTSRAAAFRTCCSGSVVHCGRPASTELQ